MYLRALFNNESLAWCAVVDFNPIGCVLSSYETLWCSRSNVLTSPSTDVHDSDRNLSVC